MDIWKYYAITHAEHVHCNPMQAARLDHLIQLLRLSPGSRVLDMASGKAELLTRLAETYAVAGVGIDISPYFVAAARAKLKQRVPQADIQIREMNGADYAPPGPEHFDLVSCLGASWIFQGHRGTLQALARMVAPGGWVIAGEPYWRQTPSAEYLAASGDKAEDFGRHAENVATGEDLGLTLCYTLVSEMADWDEYEGLQWYAAEKYAREHPEDPDCAELLERVGRSKDAYLRWGRDTVGWAIYAFRRPLGR